MNKYKKYDFKFMPQVTTFNLNWTNSENHAMAFYVPDHSQQTEKNCHHHFLFNSFYNCTDAQKLIK